MRGYAIICDPCAPLVELDTFTCQHCGVLIHIGPGKRPEDLGGMCGICWKLICPACLGQGCLPLEKRIEEMEKRDFILRSYEGYV